MSNFSGFKDGEVYHVIINPLYYYPVGVWVGVKLAYFVIKIIMSLIPGQRKTTYFYKWFFSLLLCIIYNKILILFLFLYALLPIL